MMNSIKKYIYFYSLFKSTHHPTNKKPCCLRGLVSNVRFEDLIGAKGGGTDMKQLDMIKGIFNYLQIDGIDAEEIASKAYDKGSTTYRKDKIGGYKDVLSHKQLELVNDLHGDIIKQFGYEVDSFNDIDAKD